MVYQTWAHGRVLLHLQGPVLENDGADFQVCWFYVARTYQGSNN